MRAVLVACVLIFVTTSASAQFELDISSSDFYRMFGSGTISDLAVEERGYIYPSSVCAEDGILFVKTDSPLSEPSENSRLLLLRRLPGHKVEIDIYLAPEVSEPQQARNRVIRRLAGAEACAAARAWRPDAEMLQVQTIDGHGTLSQLLMPQR